MKTICFTPFVIMLMVLTTACSKNTNQTESSGRSDGRQIEYSGMVFFLDSNKSPITNIEVAVANTPDLRNLGLMDVRNLPPDKGMLFIFEQQDRLSFWMANTPLPLDLLFVNSDYQIVHIHHNAKPFSRQQIDSVYPSLYVVEVNAGFAINHDIVEGQYIEFEL
jgi:uncharacterized protein